MIFSNAKLIPRYNWDYGLRELAVALRGAWSEHSDASDVLEGIFGVMPILTTSGRASLYAILKALNLPRGAKVGVPLFCCSVVFDAIKQADLAPVFVDVEPDDYNISAPDLDRKRKDLSAVVVVHMFGHPVDMDSIKEICKDIPVIEDCAQSLFSTYKGKQTGLVSDISFFSFRSGKYISAGEGSAVFSRDGNLLDAVSNVVRGFYESSFSREVLHCISTCVKSSLYHRPWYGLIGRPVGAKLDKKLNLTAKSGFECNRIRKADLAVIEEKIRAFRTCCDRQRANSLYLLQNLVMDGAVLPSEKPDCFSNFYQFAIRFGSPEHRDFMAEHLLGCGIDAAKYLDEIVELARSQYGYQGGCPNSEMCSKTVLSVPNHYTLSARDLDRIVDCLNRGSRQWKALGPNSKSTGAERAWGR